jgi:hypothetical protein
MLRSERNLFPRNIFTMATFLLGDIHGELDKMIGLLRGAKLINASGAWIGGDAHLYFLGDYVDRGPDGLGVIDCVMRLQIEAVMSGGRVEALLGNHDVMMLAAKRIGNTMPSGADLPLRFLWQQNGGRRRDIDGLTDDHLAWLEDRPAMALVGDTLLLHADATFYTDYGRSVSQINDAIADVLQSEDYEPWANLIVLFVNRMEFNEQMGGSTNTARDFLKQLGGRRLVHGHTPIPMVAKGLGGAPITAPWVYADGLCTNIDGGMFLGEPGFVYRLDATAP